MGRKVAIVLRGPPGGGKTTIAHALQDHFGLPRHSHIMMDDGWGTDQPRFTGIGRYADLRNQPDVLIIELGFGEPYGQAFPGATKNPAEWVRILKEEGREIFYFVLQLSLAQTIRRVRQRSDIPIEVAELAHHRYDSGAVCSNEIFSSLVGAPQQVIDTEQVNFKETIAKILTTVGPMEKMEKVGKTENK
jgi:hypothetical protein